MIYMLKLSKAISLGHARRNWQFNIKHFRMSYRILEHRVCLLSLFAFPSYNRLICVSTAVVVKLLYDSSADVIFSILATMGDHGVSCQHIPYS